MDVVLVIAGVMLVVAASLTLIRIVRGPGPADRVVATDVLITTVAGSLTVAAAINHDGSTLAVIVVLSLLAFAGTVSMARFVAGRGGVVGPGPAEAAASPGPVDGDPTEGDVPTDDADGDDDAAAGDAAADDEEARP
ncbi:multicomponent Na+:H+ antiporter subunit F [Agrococcus baldri]|uniref:Multicomponent Na+:H+ antiporter subunit F n=1 Tax=Agrococcus baldri TaxID=153730 RepID=A0AA94HNB0_9MICO|nr:monovalent cation/H+ antiporter complex subunit F [Agrococcus baldri]SFS15279.1 multicomponent Na+:H+ antiporter subunit F [Agrococcus baldri]